MECVVIALGLAFGWVIVWYISDAIKRFRGGGK